MPAACLVAFVFFADFSTPDPQLGLDGLYVVLGLLLGVNAYNERAALLRVLKERQPDVSDEAAGSTERSKP